MEFFKSAGSITTSVNHKRITNNGCAVIHHDSNNKTITRWKFKNRAHGAVCIGIDNLKENAVVADIELSVVGISNRTAFDCY